MNPSFQGCRTAFAATFLLFLSGCVAPASTGDVTLAPAPEPSEPAAAAEHLADWELLSHGQTLEAWRGFRQSDPSPGWSIQNGVIRFDPASGRGTIITRKQYDDFILELDWKVAERGNSGIFYRISEDTAKAWMTGPEMQVLDNQGHPNGRNPLTRAGALYGLYAPAAEAAHPAGEWNHVRIVVDGRHVEHWLNGVKVVAYDFGSDDWQERISGTKFEKMRWFGRNETGHIGLQDHGDPVWYRNVKIRPLGETHSSSEATSTDEWQSLLEGEHLDRWRGFGQSGVPDGWSLQDGTLYFNPYHGGRGSLITKAQYDDFVLDLEWKISIWGNSGIFYRANEEADALWKTAPEYQILDDENHPYAGADLLLYSTGAVLGLYAPLADADRPTGTWNRTRIIVRGPHIEHWLNGTQIATYEIGSARWNRRVAGSKFAEHNAFGTHRRGHIALQDHGSEVWYRNIKIRRL